MALTPLAEAGNSLNDFIDRVRDAFYTEFRVDGAINPWVADVFDDHVIVTERDADGTRRYYNVSLTVTDDAVTFGARNTWQAVQLDYVPVVTMEEALRLDVTLPVQEVRTGSDGLIDGVIVVEGKSANGNIYTKAALQAGIGVFTGALMFADHPTRTEESLRPERSVRDVVGRVQEAYLGTTKDGTTALRGKFRISESESGLRKKIEEGIIDGLSLRAFGAGKRDKSGAFVVESFQANPFTSVDLVTVAAAGGGFEALSESQRAVVTGAVLKQVTREDLARQRPDLAIALHEAGEQTEVRALQESHMAEQKKLEEVQAENQTLLAENTRLFREVRTEKAERVIGTLLGEAKGLPAPAIERVKSAIQPLVESFATHGSTQTEDELRAAVRQIVEAERAYVAQIVPNGMVANLTPARHLREASDTTELDEALAAEIRALAR